MTDLSDRPALDRIAAALDRLAPPPPPAADPAAYPAYVWREDTLTAVRAFAPLALDLLTGIDAQKAALLENSRRLAAGHAAHDVLLWGARGAGKSALVKSVVGALQSDGAAVALVEIAGDRLGGLPHLFAAIAAVPRAFVLFIDDLGFEDAGPAPRQLRSMLEGGAEARPANARLYVTANRRHIVARDLREQGGAAGGGLPGAGYGGGAGSSKEPWPINPRDVIDDKLALADRFGLSLGFHVCDQPTYVAMVRGYADSLGLGFDAKDAIAWATQRGSRSGRVAWQYVVELAGRQGKPL